LEGVAPRWSGSIVGLLCIRIPRQHWRCHHSEGGERTEKRAHYPHLKLSVSTVNFSATNLAANVDEFWPRFMPAELA
jgi:hypothetical protein